ncbi:MlaD family protein [Polynucleobacter sp. HIN5]|uniref:MlaD family protein n=1 Tax=Polynucleobacter sp. HIN5 TaxID=3047864 RepID=UPI0025723D8A|nr:MlaD family protein [Polynucleobacter sp. HIN5]BEI33913.1 MlaD family protein [Polynucleobacter sp. HIN5]
MSQSNPNYFRLGLFVFAGFAAILALVLVFGTGQLFKKTTMAETYIEQSITGLDVGAPVRFRGVKVGQVTFIGLSGSLYESNEPFPKRKEYVVVRMQIDGDENELLGPDKKLPKDLRARVKSQGITGVNYVELDYVRDMNNYKALPYNWKPEYLVIDSLPSQTDIFFSGIRKVLDNLGEMNLAETQKKFDVLLTNLNTIIGGDGKDNAGIAKSVERLNILLGRIDEVANKTELELLMREVIATTVILRQTLSSMQGDTITSIDNLKQITDQLNDFAKVASRYPSSMVWGEPPPRITLPQTGVQK